MEKFHSGNWQTLKKCQKVECLKNGENGDMCKGSLSQNVWDFFLSRNLKKKFNAASLRVGGRLEAGYEEATTLFLCLVSGQHLDFSLNFEDF